MYTVELDREACDGVFACLVRDSRFQESDDGLAEFDGDVEVEERDGVTLAHLEDDVESMHQAAEACPFDAIDVGGEEG